MASENIYIWGAGHCGVLTALDCEQKGVNVGHIQPLLVLRKI